MQSAVTLAAAGQPIFWDYGVCVGQLSHYCWFKLLILWREESPGTTNKPIYKRKSGFTPASVTTLEKETHLKKLNACDNDKQCWCQLVEWLLFFYIELKKKKKVLGSLIWLHVQWDDKLIEKKITPNKDRFLEQLQNNCKDSWFSTLTTL